MNVKINNLPSLKKLINKDKSQITIVGIDPGQTTGVCTIEESKLVFAEQLKTKELILSISIIKSFLIAARPDVVAYEDYRIYGWKTDTHTFSELHTPKLIGVIETLCYELGIPTVSRMAQPVKAFVTDDKLRTWGMWIQGKQHTRDSIRHAIFELVQK